MKHLWPLALITFKEGIRNRTFYGVSLIALAFLGFSLFISVMVIQDIGAIGVTMGLSAISLCGLLVVFFVGTNLMAKDIDRRTIALVLARPVSRSAYVLGKFLGMLLLILATVLIVGFLSFLMLLTLKTSYPASFERISWWSFVLAIAFNMISLTILTSISFLFASVTSSSFVTLTLTILVYVIGQSLSDVRSLVENREGIIVSVSPLTKAIVSIAYYAFPNLSLFDFKLHAAHGLVMPTSTVIWTSVYGFLYIGFAISLAAVLFRRKEFP